MKNGRQLRANIMGRLMFTLEFEKILSIKIMTMLLNKFSRVVRCLVRRYVTNEQRKSQNFNITEDDINEARFSQKYHSIVNV